MEQKSELRTRGTGTFHLETPERTAEFLVRRSPDLANFDAFLAALRA